MADIELKCPACGKSTTVSEFVADDGLKCRSCGAGLARPERVTAEKPRHTLTRNTYVDSEQTKVASAAQTVEAKGFWPGGRRNGRRPQRAKVRHHWYAWLVFAVLAGTMGYLRYGGGLDAAGLDFIKRYAVAAAVTLHVLVLLKAFEDAIFQGILCLLVPFYTLYYLLNVCDAVYLRAVVAGLLVGIGQDATVLLQQHLFEITEYVRAWIARGG